VATKKPTKDFLKDFGLDFQLEYYVSSSDLAKQPSGAYVFRPDTSEKTSINFDQVETFESELVSETRYSSNETDWASVIVRRNLGDPHFEVEWMAGPLPEMQPGIEVVMTYRGLIEEEKKSEDPVEFWTDANGRQMVRRLKDRRFSYELENGDLESVSSNYYPVTSG
jgi:lysosomal alpha-mannosidase